MTKQKQTQKNKRPVPNSWNTHWLPESNNKPIYSWEILERARTTLPLQQMHENLIFLVISPLKSKVLASFSRNWSLFWRCFKEELGLNSPQSNNSFLSVSQYFFIHNEPTPNVETLLFFSFEFKSFCFKASENYHLFPMRMYFECWGPELNYLLARAWRNAQNPTKPLQNGGQIA